MSQIIVKHAYNVGWGGTTGWLPLNGGDFANYFTDGANSVRIPVSCAGVFSNLSVLPNIATQPNPQFTLTLAVNGTGTALAVTPVASATTPTTDTTHTVTVAAGDDASFILTGANDSSTAGDLSFSLQFAPSDPRLSTYGIHPSIHGSTNGATYHGGAFGNGNWADTFTPGGNSNTYSIACAAGSVTRIDLKSFRGAIGVGNTYTAALIKNGVLQDGTGGTIDTRTTLTGASATSAFATFTGVPIQPGDICDLYIGYAGADLSFALAGVTASCLFQATAPNVFHWCGGSNDTVSNAVPSWHWMGSDQNGTLESQAASTVGPSSFSLLGCYVRHDSGSTLNAGSYTDTVRVNGADTMLTQTFTAPQGTSFSGLVSGTVVLHPSDLIDMQVTPAGSPAGFQFHWGLALTSAPQAPSFTTTSRVIRRLRRGPHIASQGNRVFHHKFLLDLQPGIGNVVDPGTVPQVLIRWSNNGGQTWSNEHWVSAGELGKYFTRVYIQRLGESRDRVYEVVMSDPNAWTLIGAYIDVEQGLN